MSKWYDLCETFLSKKDFCELVMKCDNKDMLCSNGHDMTDIEFTQLQHEAHLNLIRDEWPYDVETFLKRRYVDE